jgi:diguanylate cyclase (GGDEF) domain
LKVECIKGERMTNEFAAVMFILMASVLSINVIIALATGTLGKINKQFNILATLIIVWTIIEAFFYLSVNSNIIIYLANLKIAVISFVPLALLNIVCKFYNVESYVSKGASSILSLIPIMTATIAVIQPFNGLLHKNVEVIQLEPINKMVYESGGWLYVNYIYIYILIVLSVMIIISAHRTLSKFQKTLSWVFILTIMITFICSILNLYKLLNIGINITVIGAGLNCMISYVALSGARDFLTVARDDIFSYMEEGVFILNAKENIIDMNVAAKKWLKNIGFEIEEDEIFKFEEVMNYLEKLGIQTRNNGRTKKDLDIDISFSLMHYGEAFNIRKNEILDKNNEIDGYYITVFNVTKYRTRISRLERAVEIDPLTALGNRRAYESKLVEFDYEEYLPLTVIVGDVNGLKWVNDNLGHSAGDELLKVIARVLEKSCPKKGMVMRIGGDEFVVLLPNTPKFEGMETIASIEKSISEVTLKGHEPSIALGIATKVAMDESIEKLIKYADSQMYVSKSKDDKDNSRSS